MSSEGATYSVLCIATERAIYNATERITHNITERAIYHGPFLGIYDVTARATLRAIQARIGRLKGSLNER